MKRKSVGSSSSCRGLRPSNSTDSSHSGSPIGAARVDAVGEESIDEGPQMAVVSALIHDPDNNIFTSQENMTNQPVINQSQLDSSGSLGGVPPARTKEEIPSTVGVAPSERSETVFHSSKSHSWYCWGSQSLW